jgi:DNA-binding transcriptional MerR regulator
MAETDKGRRGEREANPGKLYTLSEVAKKTGISMPTLQRYKKSYQDRIPSHGAGRKQRYPESALAVFDQIKNENLGRRGRPRKDAAAPRRGRKPAAAKAAAAKRSVRRGRAAKPAARVATSGPRGRGAKAARGLLTLTQVSKTTGISYPTLVRYVKLYSGKLPHEGTGRTRRFYPEAIDVFRQLRQESGRGGRRKGSGGLLAAGRAAVSGAVSSRLKAIEASQKKLEKNFRGLIKSLQKLFK